MTEVPLPFHYSDKNAPRGYPPPGSYYSHPGPPRAFLGKRRGPFMAWLVLPIITLGIYGIVWIYKTNKELGRYDPRIKVNPWLSVLAVFPGFLLVIPPFVSVWRLGGRIITAQRAAGVPESNPVISFVLYCFGFGALYSQFEVNKIWDRYPEAHEGQEVPLYK